MCEALYYGNEPRVKVNRWQNLVPSKSIESRRAESYGDLDALTTLPSLSPANFLTYISESTASPSS